MNDEDKGKLLTISFVFFLGITFGMIMGRVMGYHDAQWHAARDGCFKYLDHSFAVKRVSPEYVVIDGKIVRVRDIEIDPEQKQP